MYKVEELLVKWSECPCLSMFDRPGGGVQCVNCLWCASFRDKIFQLLFKGLQVYQGISHACRHSHGQVLESLLVGSCCLNLCKFAGEVKSMRSPACANFSNPLQPAWRGGLYYQPSCRRTSLQWAIRPLQPTKEAWSVILSATASKMVTDKPGHYLVQLVYSLSGVLAWDPRMESNGTFKLKC